MRCDVFMNAACRRLFLHHHLYIFFFTFVIPFDFSLSQCVFFIFACVCDCMCIHFDLFCSLNKKLRSLLRAQSSSDCQRIQFEILYYI